MLVGRNANVIERREMNTELLPLPTVEDVENYFRQRPYYYTDDGTHFYANPSHRKAKGLHYIGRYLDAKEARRFYYDRQRIHSQFILQEGK